MLQENQHNKMLTHQFSSGGYQLRTACAVGHLRDPNDETAATLHIFEPRDRVQMVSLGRFAMGLAQEIDQEAQMQRSGTGRQGLLYLAAIGQEGELVSGTAYDLRQHHCGGGRLVELRYCQQMRGALLGIGLCDKLCAGALQIEGRPRQASRVEHDPDLLRALDGELTCDQVAAPGSCCPRHVAEFITLLVVAQAFEFATDAA